MKYSIIGRWSLLLTCFQIDQNQPDSFYDSPISYGSLGERGEGKEEGKGKRRQRRGKKGKEEGKGEGGEEGREKRVVEGVKEGGEKERKRK